MAKIKLLSATFLSLGLVSQASYSETLEDVFAKVMSTNPVILASKNNVDVALRHFGLQLRFANYVFASV